MEELKNHLILARMNEIVMANNDKYIIGTNGLYTCYGILFYDRKSKRGLIAHASPSQKIKILKTMLLYLKKDEEEVIEYTIIPGYACQDDYEKIKELEDYLIKNTPFNIILKPLDNIQVLEDEETSSYEFAFSCLEGKSVSDLIFPLTNKLKIK